MDDMLKDVARRCRDGAAQDRMTFPEILALLGDHGFEGYEVDFRRSAITYFLASGEAIELPAHDDDTPIAARLAEVPLRSAISEAQALVPGYTYVGFCRKAKAAGVAGYIVSLSGRRALYIGRTAETYVEHFPALG